MEERMIKLETKVAYQEGMIQDLREALDDHWRLIDGLSREVDNLKTKLSAVETSQMIDGKDEPPPPHY